MEYRTLEINVISGKDLNKVNLISKMDCYAVVFIDDGGNKPTQKKKTPVSHDTDANPTWNCPMKFTIDESAVRQNRLTLVFQVRCERALGDRDVGEVRVPIKELFDSPASVDGKQQFVNYQVRKPSGKPKGQISLSYKIGEKVAGPAVSKFDEPVKAYPAGSSQAYPPQTSYPPQSAAAAAGSYPPPPKHEAGPYPPPKYETPYAAAAPGYPPQDGSAQGYPPQGGPAPYGYPPQQAYGGYPPQGYPPPSGGYGGYPPPSGGYGGYPPQQGYGYPQQVVQPGAQGPKKNKFGMGLGAGLLGGALGGLLIGDMVSDSYDGGYDGGYDDGGGFDF